MCPIEKALKELADAGVEERGAIFTRREVVGFILDLIGYTANRALHKRRILEPSFGEGDFLLMAVERILKAWMRFGTGKNPAGALAACIRAVELHGSSYEGTRERLLTLLAEYGITTKAARQLADTWLIPGDFLLAELPGTFDYVVGNPPYVRQELIPDVLITEYRQRYATIYDRADLYIPFIERSLSLLKKGGTLGFICADRWMKNRYGARLRQMVAERYNLRAYIDMVGTDAFHEEVMAYPAITIIAREKPGKTRIARRPEISKSNLQSLARELLSAQTPAPDSPVKEIAGVAAGSEPWILESLDQLALVRRLERDFLTLEEAGCKVGIGVATGADKAFIGPYGALDVELDRKLPLVMTRDISSGQVNWQGNGIVNPFVDNGTLVELDDYPKLKAYLEARKDHIARRHVARKAPANWYRTIDRINPVLARTPKLLIPDIKGEAHIVYEDGHLYPHHNLYYIVSEMWDLKALQAILLSGIARLFVSTYSTRMRGGYLRFQAQYLRRIRVPRCADVPEKIKHDLIDAAEQHDINACNKAVFKLYGLSRKEREALGGNDDPK